MFRQHSLNCVYTAILALVWRQHSLNCVYTAIIALVWRKLNLPIQPGICHLTNAVIVEKWDFQILKINIWRGIWSHSNMEERVCPRVKAATQTTEEERRWEGTKQWKSYSNHGYQKQDLLITMTTVDVRLKSQLMTQVYWNLNLYITAQRMIDYRRSTGSENIRR